MNGPVHPIGFHRGGELARWSRILSIGFAAMNILFLSAAYGQSPQSSDASPPVLRANESATAAITFTNGASLKVSSGKSGEFPLVAANPGEVIGIRVRFPANLGRSRIIAQALDGGVIPITQQDSSLAVDGTNSIQFQLPMQSGLYRVLLNGGGAMRTLKFWIADPQNPSANSAALKP